VCVLGTSLKIPHHAFGGVQAGQNLVHYAVYTFSNKCSFYFFLQEIFFIWSFSAKSRVCFCSTVVPVAGISCCVALCPSTCLPNRSFLSDPCLARELQLCFAASSSSVAGRDAQTLSLGGSWRRPAPTAVSRSNPGGWESPGPSPDGFCSVWRVRGAGQRSWRWWNKRTPVFPECVYGIKGIYLIMKHGNKCAYIEQCEDVSYRYSTSKGRASPKPKKE